MVIILATEQKVLSLQVAVANLLQVQVLHDLDHLPEDVLGLLFGKLAHFVQPIKKLAALAETR